MLYPKNTSPSLEDSLFLQPTSEYRGTPFWAWNGKLDHDELIRQIRIFKEMGLGGFHMHVRTGLQDPYLDDAFMDAVRCCKDEAEKEEMLAYLYDEDRWPSGTAGGRVTDGHPEYARKMLMLTREPYTSDRPNRNTGSRPGWGQGNMRQDNGYLIAVYDILLSEQGRLKDWKVYLGDELTSLDPEKDPSCKEKGLLEGWKRYYAYIEHTTDDPWFNDHPYVDTMDPEAIRRFLDLTHEVYAKEFEKDFGTLIPSIFTDEPQYAPKKALDFALKDNDLSIPWTRGMEELYKERFGVSLLRELPELFLEREDQVLSSTRWQYQNLVTDRFVECFCKQVGDWCDEHRIALTGHVMNEPSLYSQTLSVGDAMRCYKPFGIPGIDMLCDNREFTTAKQTQSMVRQCGKEGMLSELYGVTGWDYDFRGYKLQGDWQAALGVTVRVPHLAWESMHGEAKRDYPASISFQSPWWQKYHLVEDHFARLNTALTRGKAKCRVAVVHPVESYWLLWGPNDQTGALRDRMDKQFLELANVLLLNQMDYDYLDEARLPEQIKESSDPTLSVGEMTYDVVVIPNVLTLRKETIQILADFQKKGGCILVQGDCPEYIDAKKTQDPLLDNLYRKAEHVGNDPYTLLERLESWRFVDVREKNGRRYDRVLYQHRIDEENEWVFFCNGLNPESPDVDPSPELTISLNGIYTVTEYDTLKGTIAPVSISYENNRTILKRYWHSHDSLLLNLKPAKIEKDNGRVVNTPLKATGYPQTRFGLVDVTFSEPNMLLLDEAEWAMNGGEYRPQEEILRIDNYAREILNIPPRLKEVAQPYTVKETPNKDHLRLRFRISCQQSIENVSLAMEDAASTRIWLNGKELEVSVNGWYVDPAIEITKLPALDQGINILEVEVPIGPNTDLEYYYLLGDFGVKIRGTERELTEPVRQLGFGDITRQELPYYTGNIDYKMTVRTKGEFSVRVPHYRGGLVEVLLDGKSAGEIIYSPYTLKLTAEPGIHELTFRLYGTRQNGFAQLHYTPGVVFYQSPNSWRSAGDLWSYEYQFKPAGILKSPEVYNADILQQDGSIRMPDTAFTRIENS